ncbi:MAG TPA: SEC-C metal-binding domain-containing protein, partial [Bryobacteraceae bacterium]|nr:SEC-C metal-binding domain-containing protein [Bryobacteraceae bacterium]
IVAQAGRKGAITVSTNMAGRGTDILLGGNPEFLTKEHLKKENKDPDALQTAAVGSPERAEWDRVFARYKEETAAEHEEVVASGGLHVLGTERHESRRIDNQLRGRAGRQGDPGSSRFYLSLQDDLMRIFGGERMQNLMLRLGMEEDVPIESKLISKRIAKAQEAVEAQNFASRKHLLEYDDVMNKQRQAVYGMRRALLEGKDQRERITEIVEGIVASFIDVRCPERTHPSQFDLTGLQSDVLSAFGVKVDPEELAGMSGPEIEEHVKALLMKRYQEKEDLIGPENMREAERIIMLNVIDNQWKDHLLSMDHLKEGIGLRGYGQKDPLIEYKKESFTMFQAMMDRIEDETIRYLFFLQVTGGAAPGTAEAPEGDGGPGVPGNGGYVIGAGPARPVLPFNPEGEDEEEEEDDGAVAIAADDRRAAQNVVADFTRNIQRKKDKEMAELQFAGGSGVATEKKQAVSEKKAGRNDPCPCGSGKKYKKCHGA